MLVALVVVVLAVLAAGGGESGHAGFGVELSEGGAA